MAAIGVLDELRFAEARFALEEKLANLERTVDQDAGRASEIETDDISIALCEGLQEPEHVRPPELIIDSAPVLALGAWWWRRHQPLASTDLAVRP